MEIPLLIMVLLKNTRSNRKRRGRDNNMGSLSNKTLKRLVAIVLNIAFVTILGACSAFNDFSELTIDSESLGYKDKILQALDSNASVDADEIFDFEFSRGFVFSDDYMSGKSFENEYDLNVSISEVGEADTDSCGRIVFVDDNGNFVFTFTYNKEAICFEKRGLIIYPDTKISKVENKDGRDSVMLNFDSTEYYYKSRKSEKYTNALLRYYESDKTLRVNNIFYFGDGGFYKSDLLENDKSLVFYDNDGVVMYVYNYDPDVIEFDKCDEDIFANFVIEKTGIGESGTVSFAFSSPNS